MSESLSVRIDSYLLSLLESLCNIFLPDTLDTKVGELNSHVVIINIHSTHSFLTPVSANTGRTNKIMRMSFRRISIMSNTAHHHHGWSLVAQYLYLRKCFLV